jgi:hypothetical protein
MWKEEDNARRQPTPTLSTREVFPSQENSETQTQQSFILRPKQKENFHSSKGAVPEPSHLTCSEIRHRFSSGWAPAGVYASGVFRPRPERLVK